MKLSHEVLESYDAVHVISDLHLGGEKGFQIFNAGSRLAGFIQSLLIAPEKDKTALVINGDFVDFLAEENAESFNPLTAIPMLQRITEDAAFYPVWQALREFVAKSNRRLIIVLGNHDLELALPWVQNWLIDFLTNNNKSLSYRIRFVTHAGGYLCLVGNEKVLCVHGNESDRWNRTDYKGLSEITGKLIQGQEYKGWNPNMGSQLVIDVMNEIKKDFPFIDLFKPEKEGAIAALLALKPELRNRIPSTLKIVATHFSKGFLGEENEFLGADLNALANPGNLMVDQNSLFEEIEGAFADGLKPHSLVKAEEAEVNLGAGTALIKSLFNIDGSRNFRSEMKKLKDIRIFDIDFKDDLFKKMDRQVARDVSFLITGHTHLCRALRRERREGYYFNTGTWGRLFRVMPEMLDKNLDKLEALFRKGNLDDFDAPEWVWDQKTVVSVMKQENEIVGILQKIDSSSKQLVELQRFTKRGV